MYVLPLCRVIVVRSLLAHDRLVEPAAASILTQYTHTHTHTCTHSTVLIHTIHSDCIVRYTSRCVSLRLDLSLSVANTAAATATNDACMQRNSLYRCFISLLFFSACDSYYYYACVVVAALCMCVHSADARRACAGSRILCRSTYVQLCISSLFRLCFCHPLSTVG